MKYWKDIFRGMRNALALYGGLCILTGVTVQQLERNWNKICDKTEDRLSQLIFGKPKERPIEVEYEEVN